MEPDQLKQAFAFKRNVKSIFYRSNDQFAAIDGLRGLSFVWMFMFHCFLYAKYHFGYDKLLSLVDTSPFLFNWLWNADKAVDTFFFLSGFLISTLLFKEHNKTQNIALVRFYKRRYLRLTPVYLFSILLFWIFRGPQYENLWQNVLYINNFFPYEEMAMAWTWTLAVEEQFYLIFPITLLWLYSRQLNLGYALITLFLLSFGIRALLIYTDPDIRSIDMSVLINDNESLNHYSSAMYDNLYTRYGAFIAGIYVAYLQMYHSEKLKAFFDRSFLLNSINIFFLVLVCIIVWLPVLDGNINFPLWFKDLYHICNRNLYSMCLAWIILLGLNKQSQFSGLNNFLSWKVWHSFAQLSYSMYIFHIIFISGLMFRVRWLVDNNYIAVDQISFWFMLAFCALALVMTYVFSIFTYSLIEKPFMNLRGGRGF